MGTPDEAESFERGPKILAQTATSFRFRRRRFLPAAACTAFKFVVTAFLVVSGMSAAHDKVLTPSLGGGVMLSMQHAMQGITTDTVAGRNMFRLVVATVRPRARVTNCVRLKRKSTVACECGKVGGGWAGLSAIASKPAAATVQGHMYS